MDRIAIFASGSGTNAEHIINHFRGHASIAVKILLSNKPDAFVLERAKNNGIPSVVFDRQQFYESDRILRLLKENGVTFIVLAGFLWLIPPNILSAFHGRILNIHPALLPKYGGKGMYGMKVHQAVIDAGDTESGITIHHVDQCYDEGNIVFQARCPVLPEEPAESLASRIHELEYKYYPSVIENVILNKPILNS